MQGIITVEDSRTARAVAQRFVRALVIGGLAAIASLGFADRVHATYFHSDDVRAPAGDYIDREWFHLLDDGQYQYLDRGQYNLLGELGYLLGHPCYPKLFERDSDQAVGFTNRQHTAWFSFGGRQVPISEYAMSAAPSIIKLAKENGIPTFAGDPGTFDAGAVIGLGVSYHDLGRQTAELAVKILNKEAKAGDLPVAIVKNPTLMVNKKVAKELKISIPKQIVERADTVIE